MGESLNQGSKSSTIVLIDKSKSSLKRSWRVKPFKQGYAKLKGRHEKQHNDLSDEDDMTKLSEIVLI